MKNPGAFRPLTIVMLIWLGRCSWSLRVILVVYRDSTTESPLIVLAGPESASLCRAPLLYYAPQHLGSLDPN